MPYGSFLGMKFKMLSEKGVSFPELVVSMAIVATILMLMMGTFLGGFHALQKSSSYNQATIMAQRTIEYFKAMDYTSVPIYATPEIIPETHELITGDDFSLTLEVVIEENTYGISQKYKKLSVTVTKTAEKNLSKSVNVHMETYLIND